MGIYKGARLSIHRVPLDNMVSVPTRTSLASVKVCNLLSLKCHLKVFFHLFHLVPWLDCWGCMLIPPFEFVVFVINITVPSHNFSKSDTVTWHQKQIATRHHKSQCYHNLQLSSWSVLVLCVLSIRSCYSQMKQQSKAMAAEVKQLPL